MNRARFASVTAMIPAGPSLAEALLSYSGQLGFEVARRSGSMAGIRRDSVEFHLVENGDRRWAENARFGVGVGDLDSLHKEYRSADSRIGPLEVKAWGRREFHMIVPPGVCFQFYEREG